MHGMRQSDSTFRRHGFIGAAAMLLGSGIAAAQPPVAHWVMPDDAARDELSEPARLRIRHEIEAALASPALRDATARRKAAGAVLLHWPLRSLRDDGAGYHGISNYVDHDPAFPGRLRDYACGTRTYDTENGYNHAGTDYFLWPFPWLTMDEGSVAAVAAAPGVIVGVVDGHPDRSCTMGDRPWNAVYLRHDDGSVTWYGHLKRGSATTKRPGDAVDAGEYLGLVGSSGSSTGPHLHFELHDATGRVVDPRHGNCNAEPERWSPPQPYRDPAINTVSLHAQEPQFVGCGTDGMLDVREQPNAVDSVVPGTPFYVLATFRDHQSGNPATFTLLRADGSEFARWQYDLADANLPRSFYTATAFTWRHTVLADAPRGNWRFRAEFQGQSYTRTFFVGTAEEARTDAVRRERAAVGALRLPRTSD